MADEQPSITFDGSKIVITGIASFSGLGAILFGLQIAAFFGLATPAPLQTEPRAMDEGSRSAFLRMAEQVDTIDKRTERQDRIQEKLADGFADLAAVTKDHATTTREAQKRIEEELRDHARDVLRSRRGSAP